MNNKTKLIISLALPLLAGFIGSLFTDSSLKSVWYENLVKPTLMPPGWLFPIAWTILFVLMGLAFYLVWQKASPSKWRSAYLIFGVQLSLNVLWSFFFFYLQRPAWALIEVVALWFSILITFLVFKKIDRRAGWLLLPYLLWVSFAIYLNYSIALG